MFWINCIFDSKNNKSTAIKPFSKWQKRTKTKNIFQKPGFYREMLLTEQHFPFIMPMLFLFDEQIHYLEETQ
jgi:hypothetical protein